MHTAMALICVHVYGVSETQDHIEALALDHAPVLKGKQDHLNPRWQESRNTYLVEERGRWFTVPALTKEMYLPAIAGERGGERNSI